MRLLLLTILVLLLGMLAELWELYIDSSTNNFNNLPNQVASDKLQISKRYWLGNWLIHTL